MIQIQHLDPGTKVKLKNGIVVVVTENPRDGISMYGRIVDADPQIETEQTVNADDVVEIL